MAEMADDASLFGCNATRVTVTCVALVVVPTPKNAPERTDIRLRGYNGFIY